MAIMAIMSIQNFVEFGEVETKDREREYPDFRSLMGGGNGCQRDKALNSVTWQ
jgi:hypothetical protein